jgi:DNA-binding CsgD family transcriptional regulator
VAVAVTASIVVGRDGELKTLAAFVAAEGARALLLEGDAGVGKTTLWYEGLRVAGAAGHHVLTCAPALTESQLSFAGIADLLEGSLEGALPGLAVPQRRALEVALLREEAEGLPPDERAIVAAFLGVLRHLGDTGPVLLAVDDAQWLDPASRSVLEFVVRRLGDEPVALLVSRRGPGDGEAPLHLGRALGPQRVQRIVVAPLSLGAFHRLLQERLGASFPRPVLRRLHENAGGNPFYGLELARALARRNGPVDRDEPLPVPVSLQELVAERLQTLSPDARRLLEIVSALLDCRTTVVADLARDEGLEGAIDEAVAVGVLEERGRRLAFTHPLLASGVYAEIGPERRRELHRLLVTRTAGEEEHAIHLGFATDKPDAEVATQLARAADRARARGATATAGRLAENAARLTPPGDDEGARRTIAAAGYYLHAGDQIHGRALLEALIERLEPGVVRAEALSFLAWIPPTDGDLAAPVRLGEQALTEAGDDPVLRAATHLRVGAIELIRGRLDVSAAHGRAAETIAREVDDDGLLTLTLASVGYIEMLRGAGIVAETRDAIAIERTLENRSGMVSVGRGMILAGMTLADCGELDEARTLLSKILARVTEAGNEVGRAGVLFHLAEVDRRAGNWEEASVLSTRSRDLFAQTGGDYAASPVVGVLLDAGMGRVERARRDGLAGFEAAQRLGDAQATLDHRGALGFVELCAGDFDAAARWLRPATDVLFAMEIGELAVHPVVHHEVEAAIATGDLERAQYVVGRVEELARRTGRPWARMIGARGRGQLLAACGDLEGALISFGLAMETNGEIDEPFEFARTLMAVGITERRAKRKRAAREALLRAEEIFAGLPAPVWAARAQAEIKRLGLRAQGNALTETEARIARLAANGRTNPEIAAEVFLSRKTVEDNLSKIYRKLGIRSRIELARNYPPSTASQDDRDLTD